MEMPSLIIGTFQNNNYPDLLNVVKAAIESGYRGFDTAPSYHTESSLGQAIHDCMIEFDLCREDFYISDKIDGWQMQERNGDITSYVETALKQMNMDYFDLLLIHWPFPEYLNNTWDCFQRLYKSGLAKSIGICNVRVRHLIQFLDADTLPHVIQIERHPLNACIEEVSFCANYGIKVQAYSPMCRMDYRLQNSPILEKLSQKYNKNVGQIILRWHIDTNVTPVFMTKKPSRICENTDIFDFSLTKDEINNILSLNQNYKIFLESWGCPGF